MTEINRDPVCGMQVTTDVAADKSEYNGTTYYFCCPGCLKAFEKDPNKYVGQAASTHTHACC